MIYFYVELMFIKLTAAISFVRAKGRKKKNGRIAQVNERKEKKEPLRARKDYN